MGEETTNVTGQEKETVQMPQPGRESGQGISDSQNKKKKALPFIIAAAVVLIAP